MGRYSLFGQRKDTDKDEGYQKDKADDKDKGDQRQGRRRRREQEMNWRRGREAWDESHKNDQAAWKTVLRRRGEQKRKRNSMTHNNYSSQEERSSQEDGELDEMEWDAQ